MRIYISGPMTGYPDLNAPAFAISEARWKQAGWEPINPQHNFGGRRDLDREDYMREDYKHLLSVDAIAMLPGWHESEGALSELNMARELGLEVFDADTMLPAEYGVAMVPLCEDGAGW